MMSLNGHDFSLSAKPIENKLFYLNEPDSSNIICQNKQQHTLEQHNNIISNTQPIETNTFVQLETENNNHACIPRVCRFRIARITLNSENCSVLFGIKLDASKRSIRTADIPLKIDSSQKEFNHFADVNLNYNIAYPHFLKKDSNFIYFYVQKRKKLKNRTILGFKTLAFTAIDLSSILQKSFANDLPLFYFNNKIPLILNNTNLQNMNNPANSQHIIGSLTIVGLSSLPMDAVDLENNFHFNRSYSMRCKNSMDNEDLIDDEEMENIDNDKEDCVNIKLGYISESDAENDIMVMKQSKKELEKVQHPKNFTSKIMSFIKKLRNENLLAHNDENEHADEAEEDEEGDYDFEYDSIDQCVSDYDNSDSDNSNADLYSIVSTPKPKLEPYFKNNSNPDLRSLNSNNFLSSINNPEPSPKKTISSFETPRKVSIKKNRSSSLNSSYQDKYSKMTPTVERVEQTLQTIQSEVTSFYLIEHTLMKEKIEPKLNTISSNFFIDLKKDFACLLDLILKLNIDQNNLELIIIGSDQFFNEFLKFYVQFLKNRSKLLNVFFIAFGGVSTIGATLGKFSVLYSKFFTDNFWTSLKSTDLVENTEQVVNRINKYIELGRMNQYKKLAFQIANLTINEEVLVPFIVEVKLELSKEESPPRTKLNENRRSLLSTSNSLPQFFNNMTSSNSLLINTNPSTDSSYLNNVDSNETDNDLQLDYYRMEGVSINGMMNADYYTSDEYSTSIVKDLTAKNNIKKRTILGHFKRIQVYRKPTFDGSQNSRQNKNFDKFLSKNFQSSINCVSKSVSSTTSMSKISQDFLSLDYVLKEKKPKIRLSTKRSMQKNSQKEINKITKLNLKHLDENKFDIKFDGCVVKDVKSIELTSDCENKCLQIYLIIP